MTAHRIKSENLFVEVSLLLHKQDLNDVFPVLITATARALVQDANGDLDKLEKGFNKFVDLVRDQTREMILADLDASSKATKQ
jgi:hypothetical protein